MVSKLQVGRINGKYLEADSCCLISLHPSYEQAWNHGLNEIAASYQFQILHEDEERPVRSGEPRRQPAASTCLYHILVWVVV